MELLCPSLTATLRLSFTTKEEKIKLSEELGSLMSEQADQELQQFAEDSEASTLARTGSIVSSDGRPLVRRKVCRILA